ncbi:MAG: ABC transporter ATP-binding protein [Chloroflexi bacterium]|nr:ABC transporter ATP-binding protein [Chloroflexota bacterium]
MRITQGSVGARLHVDIEKQWPGFRLSVRLAVGAEITVLFGPSGAGKSTTLSAIAGLVTPDAGEIRLDDRALFRRGRPGAAINVPARSRRIGYVFQGYALFPHLTALENVAYPLQVGRLPWSRRVEDDRAAALLERMRLAHLAGRYPHELSGGQQQRVAIARALAADPQVLLLDEPFSALDSAMRERLQRDLRDLQAELGLTVLYVTHRLEDAFALGHRLAVIRDGQVAQIGPIEEVFRRPASYDVAEVMGIRNLFRATVIGAGPGRLLLDWDGLRLEAPPLPIGEEPAGDTVAFSTPGFPLPLGNSIPSVGATVTAYIRPEDIKVLYPDRPVMGAVARNQVTGRITESREGAGYRLLRVVLPNGHEVELRFSAYTYVPLSLLAGDVLHLSLRKEGLVLLPPPKVASVIQPQTGNGYDDTAGRT